MSDVDDLEFGPGNGFGEAGLVLMDEVFDVGLDSGGDFGRELVTVKPNVLAHKRA